MKRKRELDFLRGIAIILVILRHQYLFSYAKHIGWIGVDLFFVLSGFFVSGLLFKEYIRHDDIKPADFLIRRGFKIYPIYYIFYLPYLIPIIALGKFKLLYFLSDMFFVQNYVTGWGYAYVASWSLAIEEHFYFALALGMAYVINKRKFRLRKQNLTAKIETVILTMMLACLIMRIAQNYFFPALGARNLTMTHLRIDSLLAGVLVSYWYHFKLEYLKSTFEKTKQFFFPAIVILISFTPFLEPATSFFERTIGFTLLYLAFSLLLIYFLLTENINRKLNAVLTRYVVDAIAEIGLCSYSIYIIHIFVMIYVNKIETSHRYLLFFPVFGLSVLIGKIMTDLVERYFLKIRDKYYPGRLA